MLVDVDVWVWDRKKLSQNYDLQSNSPLPPTAQGTGTNILFPSPCEEQWCKTGNTWPWTKESAGGAQVKSHSDQLAPALCCLSLCLKLEAFMESWVSQRATWSYDGRNQSPPGSKDRLISQSYLDIKAMSPGLTSEHSAMVYQEAKSVPECQGRGHRPAF